MIGPDDEEDDDHVERHEDEDDDMEKRHPGHTKEAYDAGRFLGVDFPYVPGDPFW